MEIEKILFEKIISGLKTEKSFEDLDINHDGKINSDDLSLTDNDNIKGEISKILEYDNDEESELLDKSDFKKLQKTGKINKGLEIKLNEISTVNQDPNNEIESVGKINTVLETTVIDDTQNPEPPAPQSTGLYYDKGKLANGEVTINGVKMYFIDGIPSAGVVENQVRQYYNYLVGYNNVKEVTVYGDNGKLLTGEYNHKMYKEGKLLTGPYNGNYYVAGVQDDTFSGTGSDGLMYENGQPLTGTKGSAYYYNGKIADGKCGDLYYDKGQLANGAVTVNGVQMYFTAGKPSAGVEKTTYYGGWGMYSRQTTVDTVYGDDGKLLTGEYNHKMYKNGKLLTGPYNGNYYVAGVQDDTFSGTGSDGLMYDNGQPLTGTKGSAYYYKGQVANGLCGDLYYNKGQLANGEVEINGVKMYFTAGKPSAGVVKKESTQYNYTSMGYTTIKTQTVYGDNGKLLTGEYNHKMYKNGGLLTGPYNGNYYVAGVQDDTFSGTGSDGLMYENGKPLTGTKGSAYYYKGQVANGLCGDLYYNKGQLANGEVEINGVKMYFTAGKPSAGVVEKESTQYNYTSMRYTTIKTQTVYGDNGKLLTGEYNHKMYKNGRLLTGPYNGNYYVNGVQDDTFSGTGSDGLMYENGKLLTGTKGSIYYYKGQVANGLC